MKTTPLFSFLLTMWLLLTISDSMPIVGAIIHGVYLYLLAFFTPFISRKELIFMLGVSMGRLTFVFYFKGLADYWVNASRTGVFWGWLILMGMWLYAYALARVWLRKHGIRKRVGKWFQ